MIMKKIYLMLLFISIINIAQLKAADNFTNLHRPIRLKMQNGHFNKPTQAKSDVKSKPIAVEYGLPKSILGKYFTDSMYTYSFKSLSDSLLTGKDYEKYEANGLTSVSYILDTNTNKRLVIVKLKLI